MVNININEQVKISPEISNTAKTTKITKTESPVISSAKNSIASKSVKIKNNTRFSQHLQSYDGDWLTVPPNYIGAVDAKFVTWCVPNPKIITVYK